MFKWKVLICVSVCVLGFAGRSMADGPFAWKTVDNPTLQSPGGNPWKLTKDFFGHIYAEGIDGVNCITRKSDIFGLNWQTVDSFQNNGESCSAALGAHGGGASAKGHTIFTGFQTIDATGHFHWVVRESSDEGKTWVTVDDWATPQEFGYVDMRNLKIGDDDHIYETGGMVSLTNYHDSLWVTRGSEDGGKTWKILDYYKDIDAFATDVNVDTLGNVVVTGQVGTVAPQNPCEGSVDHEVVRKSTDFGKTWKNYDGLLNSGKCFDFPTSLQIDGMGSYYIAGIEGFQLNSTTFENSAYIRVSNDGGKTWNFIEYGFELPGSTYTESYQVKVNDFGQIFTSGHGITPNGIDNWYVKTLTSSGWQIIDLYQGETGLGAESFDMIFDNFGSLFASGYYLSSATTIGWAVRKYEPQILNFSH